MAPHLSPKADYLMMLEEEEEEVVRNQSNKLNMWKSKPARAEIK